MSQLPKCLVVSEYYLPVRGGHVIWLHELCKRMGDSAIVLTGMTQQLPRDRRIDGVDVRPIRLARWALLRPESLPLYVNYIRRGRRIIRRDRCRAIVAARVLPEGLVANVLARMAGIPSVLFAHGEEISRMNADRPLPRRRRLTAALKRRWLWRTFRRADMIIANSTFTGDLLSKGGIDAGKIHVVHPGTDVEVFRPMGPDGRLIEQLRLAGKKVILTVGRLRTRKGQDTVLRAMPEILSTVPNAVYLIVGTGPQAGSLRELAESLHLENHVRFVGEADQGQLPKLFSLADVFLMANRELPATGDVEGFGIVFLEAGACGVPVIGGNSGGVPDAIADGETGFLIDGNSPREVADATVRILKDKQAARRLGEKGRDRVCREFTWDHSAERIIAMIEQAATGRAVPAPGTC